MKNGFLKTSILLLTVVLSLAIIVGCKKKEAAAGQKTVQILEQENKELAKQLEARDKETADLKSSIAKSNEERDAAKKTLDMQMQALGDEMIKMFEENAKLEVDVNSLKKQIEQLKAKPN